MPKGVATAFVLDAHRNSGEPECMVPLHFGGQFRPNYQLHTDGMNGNTGEFLHAMKYRLAFRRSRRKTHLPLVQDGNYYPSHTALRCSVRVAGMGRLCEGTRGVVGLQVSSFKHARHDSHE